VSKRKPNQLKDPKGAPASAGGGAPARSEELETTSRRPLTWLARVAALVLGPLLVLGGAELGLRLVGYGYATAFFRPLRIGNRNCLVGNDQFGLRFFPPELARIPPPLVMEAKKGPGVRRVFLLGESAALGDPRPAYGAGRYFQVLLEERFPGTRFEVVCGAVTAINSHGVLPIARECARRQGDLWIIYMGNNEMVGPFGPCSVFGAQAPPLWRVRLGLALEEARLGQLLTALARSIRGRSSHGPSWGGMRMFMESRLAPSDPKKEVAYRSFRRNLNAIVGAGRAAGVPILLSTVAVNQTDCPPFASMPAPTLSDTDLQAQARLRAEAVKAEEKGDLAGAAQKFEAASRLDPALAELQYRWGRCLLRSWSADHGSPPTIRNSPPTVPSPPSTGQASPSAGDLRLAEAREHFERAVDDDALPFRADSRINAIIRQVAGQFAGAGVGLCDAAAVLAAKSPAGVPGAESFYEHVHLSFDGNYTLARAWAAAAEPLLARGAANAGPADWASQAVCERRLALTAWNRCAVLEDVLRRLSQPPFTAQLEHSQRVESVRGELRAARRGLSAAAAAEARSVCAEALERAPGDHRLHENTAEFLEGIGDLQGALAQWQQVVALIPYHHVAYFQCGRLLARLGDLAGAEARLSHALKLRPDLAEGWLEMGNVCARRAQPALALEDYRRGMQLAPQDYRMYYHAGRALSKLGRGPEAIGSFQCALELRPDFWEGHYELGEELAFAGRGLEARQQFEEVLRLKPDYAMAHLNLGVALFHANEMENALRHFQEAARLDPTNPLAREYLNRLTARKK